MCTTLDLNPTTYCFEADGVEVCTKKSLVPGFTFSFGGKTFTGRNRWGLYTKSDGATYQSVLMLMKTTLCQTKGGLSQCTVAKSVECYVYKGDERNFMKQLTAEAFYGTSAQ